MESKKLKLIPDWKQSWKFASVITSGLGVALMSLAELLGPTWNELPDSIQERVPHASTVALGLFALSMIVRIIKFRKDCTDDCDQDQ